MEKIETFSDLKLSENTLKALHIMNFIKPTKVQLKAIPICLKERDVVVQAKTGSGKTLCFLIPLIELLSGMKCDKSFGVQSIILVPTAELAMQTVYVLSNLIKFYPQITYLSVVGGKTHTGKKEEWAKINDANIVISTLGRLLEHQEKNSLIDLTNVKYVVIDETDYMLEETFFEEMEAMIKYLPTSRVNWLFSATQSSVVAELKRLSLKNPIMIGVEDDHAVLVPKNLTQCFMKIELQDKLQALWNLLEAQHKANTIVFFSTQKQVLFFYRLFTSLNPAYSIVQLRSNMRLDKRSETMERFLSSAGGCVLFATDIASRGLDFPKVSLVIQYDLPREFDYYVHRAGRTARFDSRGTSVLMVMPSEIGFLSLLKSKNLILRKISNNVMVTNKRSIAERASMKYSTDIELFKIAKSAFLAYLRDYAKRPARLHAEQQSAEIFVVNKLPLKLFSKSMGFKSIPEECSTMQLVQPTLTSLVIDDQPFLTVKKKINTGVKRKLDLSMVDDSDSDNECHDQANTENDNTNEETILPAFNFEEEFEKLTESSAADRKYFVTYIKPKYQSRKKKESKMKHENDMEVGNEEGDSDANESE